MTIGGRATLLALALGLPWLAAGTPPPAGRELDHREARGSRAWTRLVAVGDAAVRAAEVSGRRDHFLAQARAAYLAALFRARDAGSLDGVRDTAARFAALGDTEVVDRALRIAAPLAALAEEAGRQGWRRADP